MYIRLSLLQTSVNDHWHFVSRLTDVTTTRDEDIDLESGEYLPFGQNWTFDLDLEA